MIRRLQQVMFAAFLISFPFSLRWVVFEDLSYHFGDLNPWVTGFIYAPEALLFASGILWLMGKNKKGPPQKNVLLWLGLLIGNGLLISITNGTGMLGIFWLVRLIEAYLFYCLLKSEILPVSSTILYLLIGGALQLFISEFQYFLNHSLGLTWLGESRVGPDILGVAKHDLTDGSKQVRAYGTFLHPNILAAYLLVLYFIARPYFKKYHAVMLLGLTLLGLLWSFSRAALMIFAIGFLLSALFKTIKTPKKIHQLSVVIMIVVIIQSAFMLFGADRLRLKDPSWQERQAQMNISRAMLAEHPLGVGIGSFTLKMPDFSATRLSPWDFQPVHNNYLLILNETGLQGLLIILIGIYYYFQKRSYKSDPVVPLLIILLAVFDHFFWTSWAGLMLIALALWTPTRRVES